MPTEHGLHRREDEVGLAEAEPRRCDWGVMRGFLLLALVPVMAAAADLIQERAVSFQSRVRQSDRSERLWQTEWGSFHDKAARQRVIELTIRVVGNVRRDFEAEWFFFGRREVGEGRIACYGHGRSAAVLDAGNKAVLAFESLVTEEDVLELRALGSSQRTGIKPTGWAVMLWQDGQLVAATGSTPEMAVRGRAWILGLKETGMHLIRRDGEFVPEPEDEKRGPVRRE